MSFENGVYNFEDIVAQNNNLTWLLEYNQLQDVLQVPNEYILETSISLNERYAELRERGHVIVLTFAAARSSRDGPVEFFSEEADNAYSLIRLHYCEYARPPYYKIQRFVGCYDGFHILPLPKGGEGLFLRCDQGGLFYWHRVDKS